MTINESLTVGYIGNGKSANRYHLPFVLQRKDKIKVKTIFSPDHANNIWGELEGVLYTEELDALLNDKDISLIVICTPASTHYELALKVLSAGKHCLVKTFYSNKC